MQEEEGKYSNEVFTISSVTSNAIRNIGLHMGTPFEPVNSFLERGIYKLHRVLGIDPNDPRTTWTNKEFHITFSFHESNAGNVLHLLLIIGTLPLIASQRPRKEIVYYLICLVGAFLLFSLYLRWQPWHSRLHLPLFVLWSPLLGLAISQIKSGTIVNLSMVILSLASLPFAVKNVSHPILGKKSILTTSRVELFFINRPALKEPYLRAVEVIVESHCSKIGLILPGGGFEYPLWALLPEKDRRTTRFEHVNITNISQAKSNEYPYNIFIPCAVVVVDNNQTDEVQVGDRIYVQKMVMSPVGIFMQR
jgi:hypothetical protein